MHVFNQSLGPREEATPVVRDGSTTIAPPLHPRDESHTDDEDVNLPLSNTMNTREEVGGDNANTSTNYMPLTAPLPDEDIPPAIFHNDDATNTGNLLPVPRGSTDLVTTTTKHVPSTVAAIKPSNTTLCVFALLFPTSELDLEAFPSSKAFSPQVGIYRLPSPVWCALPVIQPIILILCIYTSGALCSLVLILSAIAMLAVGIVCHLMFRPQRILLSNIVQGVALILNTAMLIVSSLLVDNPIHVGYVDASRSIAKVQLSVTILQIIHDVGIALYMYVLVPDVLLPSPKPRFTVPGALTPHIAESSPDDGDGVFSDGSLNYYFWGRGRGVGSPLQHDGGDENGAVVVDGLGEIDNSVRGQGQGNYDMCEELLQTEVLLRDEK